MNTSKHLMHIGATELEKRAAECLRVAVSNQIPIADLINPEKCPVKLLPYLAWAFSVDQWDENWHEIQKRLEIKRSFSAHKKKGTVGIVRRIVESLNYAFEIREWFAEKRQREPGTFRLFVKLQDTALSADVYEELIRLIEDSKPVSRHLSELAIVRTINNPAYICSAQHSGEIITIYPRAK